jgi:hypothetical protein
MVMKKEPTRKDDGRQLIYYTFVIEPKDKAPTEQER